MAYQHIKNSGWPIIGEDWQNINNKFQETTRTPFIFSGGHLKVDDQNNVSLFGNSGDYGGNIFFTNVNNIAGFILSTIDIKIAPGPDINAGSKFIQGIMQVMQKHKRQADFYEQLVEFVNGQEIYGGGFTNQHIGALMMMKVNDRMLQEDGDFFSIMTDEITGGLSRYILVSNVAKNIHLENNSNQDVPYRQVINQAQNTICSAKNQNMKQLDVEQAKEMATSMGPTIRYDSTSEPWFPASRTDVAVIARDAEDGHSYGRSALYIAYDNGQGTKIEKFYDTGNIHDNFHIWSVEIINGDLIIKVGHGKHNPTLRKKLSELGLPD